MEARPLRNVLFGLLRLLALPVLWLWSIGTGGRDRGRRRETGDDAQARLFPPEHLQEWERQGGIAEMRENFEHLDEQARKVIDLADAEAQRFNHNYIGTEHLLLGLIREEEGVAAEVLDALGVKLQNVRNAVEFIIGRGERRVVGQIGLTPRAKKVLHLARDEARRLGHDYVGTEHLLLGLIREGEGIAAGVLESLGVNLEAVRNTTLQVLGQTASSQPEFEARPDEEPSIGTRGGHRRLRMFYPTQKVQWEYLVLHTAQEGGTVRIQSISAEEVPSFDAGQTPMHEALRILGDEGWELVGIDRSVEAAAGALYVFKRVKHLSPEDPTT